MSHHETHHFEKILTEDHSSELGHVQPLSYYLGTFGALIVLTVITVWIAQFDFGNINMVVAMGIASIKASLVALFFMHLKYENKSTWLYALFPLVLLAILIGGTMIDNPFRTTGNAEPAIVMDPVKQH